MSQGGELESHTSDDGMRWAFNVRGRLAGRPPIERYVDTYRMAGMSETEIGIRVDAIAQTRDRQERLAAASARFASSQARQA